MRAYITLLGTASYLPGVLALNQALKRVRARHALVVAVSASVPEAAAATLRDAGLATIRLDRPAPIDPRLIATSGHWAHTFDKISVFGLADFDKLVFIDSDMLVLDNLDELFEKPPFSAVAAGQSLHAEWIRLNSGLMVIEPRSGLDREIFEALPKALAQRPAVNDGALGDQDILNAFLPAWPSDASLHLDEAYNVFQSDVDRYVSRLGYRLGKRGAGGNAAGAKQVKIIHFIGAKKPWMKGAVINHWLSFLRERRFGRLQNRLFFQYRRLIRASTQPAEAGERAPSAAPSGSRQAGVGA